ncbi:hypothetical protein GCM10023160_09200 [Brachybacterium paraconglomeratum]|uniref:hypothetical protein n=1 Tax=Brachybacterium paraconglomeratum TaxID=173362 RepID=UPI0031EB7013
MSKISLLATGLAVASIAFAGCSGGSEGDGDTAPAGGSDGETSSEKLPEQVVYQFDEARVERSDDQEPFVSSDSEVVVQLSDDLKAAIPDERSVAVDHFVLSSKAFVTGMCRLDVEVVYTESGQQALAESNPDSDESPQEKVFAALADGGVDEEDVVDEIPADEDLEKDAQYFTSDFSHMTLIDECSEDDDNNFAYLRFSYEQEDTDDPDAIPGELGAFANVSVAVIPGGQGGSEGTSMIINGFTHAEVGVTGEWSQPGS